GAGSSRRMDGVDKVWATLGAHPVIWHSVDRLAPMADQTVLVVREDQVQSTRLFFAGVPRLVVVAGGEGRQDSVRNGLVALGDVEVIAIHDVARPLAPSRLLEEGRALRERF